jgi:multicomponent Na+:H+ antiporter subunit B
VIELVINMVLLTLLALVTLAIIRVRNLFAVVVLASAYSFLMASVMMVLDAVDVAMTEASVGAGVSMVLMLGVLHLTKTEEARPAHTALLPLFVAGVTGAVLIWAVSDLPPFGAADTPVHLAGPDYIDRSLDETGIPNVVTAVLASYRGFDTLGETTVIFTAGVGVLLLLRRRRKRRREGDAP